LGAGDSTQQNSFSISYGGLFCDGAQPVANSPNCCTTFIENGSGEIWIAASVYQVIAWNQLDDEKRCLLMQTRNGICGDNYRLLNYLVVT